MTTNRIQHIATAVLAAAALSTTAVSTAACSASLATTQPTPVSIPASTPVVAPAAGPALHGKPTSPADALALLATLTIAPEDTGAHYNRNDWPHWIRQPAAGRGCDTREWILRQQGRNSTAPDHTIQVDPDTCQPYAGHGNSWISPYDGVTTTDPAGLDIDHVVALEQATRSATRSWTTAQRQSYANDPDVLIAVTAKANRQKGSQDPAHWLPDAAGRCPYLLTWVFVKAKYHMTVDQTEHAAIASALRRCPAATSR